LGTLEALATQVASMWFERNMNSNVTGDMISLDSLGITVCPGTGQTEVVGRFASDMFLAQVIIKILGFREKFGATCPLTQQILCR